MKENDRIDTMLSQHAPKPKREIRNNFTETIVSELRTPKRSGLLAKLTLLQSIRWRTKVGFATLAAALAVSGTVAAIALWPRPSVAPTILQPLSNGDRIVGYDTQNCDTFDELNGGPTKPTHDVVYYEVRKGSSVTDHQLQSYLLADCEGNLSGNAISGLIKQYHLEIPGMMSTSDYTVKAITSSSITLALDPHYNPKYLIPGSTNPQTYTRFSSGLVVYDEDSKLSYNDLKVGDTVTMVVQDTSGQSTETAPAKSAQPYDPLSHPGNVKILAILKVPPLTGDPGALLSLVGTDLVRVQPCITSKTGFCRLYPFVGTPQH